MEKVTFLGSFLHLQTLRMENSNEFLMILTKREDWRMFLLSFWPAMPAAMMAEGDFGNR